MPTKRAVGPLIHRIRCIILKKSGGDTPARPATILYMTVINVQSGISAPAYIQLNCKEIYYSSYQINAFLLSVFRKFEITYGHNINNTLFFSKSN